MLRIIITSLALCLVIVICIENATAQQTASTDCSTITKETADRCIRLNEIQVLGTHNSYHLAPTSAVTKLFDNKKPGWSENLQYSHRPLTEQFEELGIRQIELDIFADPEGGLYAEPTGAVHTNEEQFIRPEEMMDPGFKVLHVPDIDYRTTCQTLKSCLSEVRDWSLSNPNHLPILILLEVKDGAPGSQWKSDEFSFVNPVPVDQSNVHNIDKEIWDVFSRDHVIVPDEIRGDFSSLEEAILTQGWPTLAESRGRILLALDNTDEVREAYLSQSPGLEGRALFVSSEPGEPTAAFIKMNDAIDDGEQIEERIAAGYLIRTRADIPVQEGRTGDTTRRNAALESGGQFISTDYPEPSPFESGYQVTLPGAESPGRCNPVSAPAGCNNDFIKE